MSVKAISRQLAEDAVQSHLIKVESIMLLLLRRSAFLFVFLPVLSVAQLEIAGCKSYEPALVSLHGILVRETFAGPPNYRDIHKGDEPEAIWLLKLESPICVDEDKAQPDLNPSQRNVRKVQLVLNKEYGERANVLLGKRVVASGTLFGAHTGHHYTSVLLTVTYLDLPRWK
jgi:hypothetical protein